MISRIYWWLARPLFERLDGHAAARHAELLERMERLHSRLDDFETSADLDRRVVAEHVRTLTRAIEGNATARDSSSTAN